MSKKWTEYELATKSGLPQSTISSWYRKNLLPTLPSLEKICNALGITMSELFNESKQIAHLNKNQEKFLKNFNKLSLAQQNTLLKFIESL